MPVWGATVGGGVGLGILEMDALTGTMGKLCALEAEGGFPKLGAAGGIAGGIAGLFGV